MMAMPVNTASLFDLATPFYASPDTANAKMSATFLASSSSPKSEFAWNSLPCELKLKVLSYFGYTNLVRASRASREFHQLCFDGQLWATFNVQDNYKALPVATLRRVLANAGPYIRSVNLRGCSEMMNMEPEILGTGHCTNITAACLEDTNMSFQDVNALVLGNQRMVRLNVSGLSSFMPSHCDAIASTYSMLEVLDLSWCHNITAADVIPIVKGCTKLRDLNVSRVKGFYDPGSRDLDLCNEFYKHTGNLERLVLSCNKDINSRALCCMMHGLDAMVTGNLPTTPRKLQYLDISNCTFIDDVGIMAVGSCAPDLEALFLSGLFEVSEEGLQFVLRSAKNLANLNVEGLEDLTDSFLARLAASPCANTIKTLCLSKCVNLTDLGVVRVLQACPLLSDIQLDNTRITNDTLVVACRVVQARPSPSMVPYIGLTMDVYDCAAVNWRGVQTVLQHNGRAKPLPIPELTQTAMQIISLKCHYTDQQVFHEHLKRILKGDYVSARRLERRWNAYTESRVLSGRSIDGYRRHMRHVRVQRARDRQAALTGPRRHDRRRG